MVHALELLEIKFAVLSILQVVQGELDVGTHLVAVHRVDKKSHLFLRNKAFFISIEDKKTKLEDLGDLEETLGRGGRHELAEIY